MIGHINSIETMGLVDGPGIRFVTFLSGCNLRCVFCHNPETWNYQNSFEINSEELLKRILKYRHYYSNGGVTFSGGEPLLQPLFLIDILKKCKMANLHTAIDTAGVGVGYYDEILRHTDLVILDIKAIDEDNYSKITGKSMKEFKEFLKKCQDLNKRIWIRQVIIPGINDTEEYILQLKRYLSKIKNIEKVELLPYHLYGIEKYKKLNLDYRLKNVKAMDIEKCQRLQALLNR